MTSIWEIKGRELGNCNCAYGCPCQFNALPTHGDCHAVVGYQIDEGHHGDVRLDGLRAALIASWPGPIHEGNGTIKNRESLWLSDPAAIVRLPAEPA